MTDFVIVIAVAAAMATPTASPSGAPSVPTNAKTVGFKVYADIASCEAATATLTVPPGSRLVCLPVTPSTGEMASAH